MPHRFKEQAPNFIGRTSEMEFEAGWLVDLHLQSIDCSVAGAHGELVRKHHGDAGEIIGRSLPEFEAAVCGFVK